MTQTTHQRDLWHIDRLDGIIDARVNRALGVLLPSASGTERTRRAALAVLEYVQRRTYDPRDIRGRVFDQEGRSNGFGQSFLLPEHADRAYFIFDGNLIVRPATMNTPRPR